MLALLNKIEPTLPEAEELAYRQHFLAVDRARAAGSFAIVLALTLGVFILELTYLDAAQIAPLAVIRVLFFAFSFGTFMVARGPSSPDSVDGVSFVWSVAFVVQLVALEYVRPASRIDDIGMMVVTLAIYAFSPASLIRRVVPSILVCAGYVAVLIRVRDTPLGTLWPTIFIFIAINALGIVASARLQTQRRNQFHSQEELRRSILERDALIDRLRQSHKMESMGRIVGGVAHDFNNILGTMLASVEFLLDELPDKSTSRADAETIRASVKRGAELTQQLLAFSRQQVLELKVVSLNELVADTQRMLMRTIGEDVAIRVALGEHLAAVRVDPGQLQQILLNLSVNARDA
ncbi:MAG TPA: histidine kinase dimerization/phospho-acceptor domain-containing protein, partial [Gemmatimonadaceae bacterium]